jgi:hypothetical protein
MPPVKSFFWVAATLIAALLVEASLYRRGWYNKYFEPSSSAGSVELPLYWLKRFRPAQGEVLVVGDSRVAEGFSAPQAGDECGKRNLTFWNMGIPGTFPRVWYYVLRDADPTRRRFEAIVFAMDNYNDEDQNDNPADHVWDIDYLVARLRLTDIFDFASSMKRPEDRRAALIGATLKGTVIQSDARDFLNGISSRIARTRDARERGIWFQDNYGGHSEDLQGLTADWSTRTVHFPPGLSEDRRHSITESLMPKLPPPNGETTRYRMLWLGRILALYRNSPTRLIFFEMSRGPLPQPERAGPQTFLNWARRQSNVTFLDQMAFRDFERPELYFDGFHFNRKGRKVFTARFARLLLDVVPARH